MFKSRIALFASMAAAWAFLGCGKSSNDADKGSTGPDAGIQNPPGADAAAPVCLNGPNGWCWWLFSHPSTTAAWVEPPSPLRAHALLNALPASANLGSAGVGFSFDTTGKSIDLRPFDRIVAQATVSSEFQFLVANVDGTAGCTSAFTGNGTRQTYELSFATCNRWTTGTGGFDFARADNLHWSTAWGKASTVDIEVVPDILFCRGSDCTTNPLLPPTTSKPDTGIPSASPDAGAPASDAPSCGTAVVPSGQSPDDVTFLNGLARGPLHGWTWPAWGKLESVTGVTCLPGTYVPNLHGYSCDQQVIWTPGNTLCLSGNVPMVAKEPAATLSDRLSESWGLAIGVHADMCNGTIGRSYSTIAVSATGIPPEAIQAGVWLVTVHETKDGNSLLYYAKDTGEGKPIPLTQFNTMWWDPAAGVYLKAQDVANIDQVTVSVMSSTSRAISVSNLCLSKISFGGGSPDAGTSTDPSSVTFNNGKPSGAMNGWAWPTMGQNEVITDPLCQPNLVPPTINAMCSAGTKWNSPTQLCLSGSTPVTSDLDRAQNWGMGIAVSVGETEGTPLGRNYSTMAFQVSGVPANVLSRGRFVVGVHRAGDPVGTMYQVANNGLGQPVRLTDMNSAWWNTAQGLFLTAADVPKIDRVEIDVMADSVPFTVSNLCLSGIVFGN